MRKHRKRIKIGKMHRQEFKVIDENKPPKKKPKKTMPIKKPISFMKRGRKQNT